MAKRPSKAEARAILWTQGSLRWKCHSAQKIMYDLFYEAPASSTLTWLTARQFGKSTLFAILALETALRKPNSVIKLVTDTKNHVRTIFQPIFTDLLVDCPVEIMPAYHIQDYCYKFHNGSQIQLAGSDGRHYEKLRGSKTELALVDEAGFCTDLDDMVKSVLFPTTTHTGGKIVLASTPPESMDHPFMSFVEKAELDGTLVKKTIYENPLLTENIINNIIAQMGGTHTAQFKREYLCILEKDSNRSVVPEFTKELEAEIVREWPTPAHFDAYEAMDWGGKDLTVVLFGYYDFRANKVIVQDELVMDFRKPDQSISLLVKQIQEKEAKLWYNIYTNEQKEPYKRVSDINYVATNEILQVSKHKIRFETTKKDDLTAAVNNVRERLNSKQIVIYPQCRTLLYHLRNVKWKTGDKSIFARAMDDSHYDAFSSLVYLIRSIDYRHNPYPSTYGRDPRDVAMFDSYTEAKSLFNQKTGQDKIDIYKKMFNIKAKR